MYKQKNLDWLRDKAAEEGVKELANGICYRVIKSGKGGVKPNRNSVVTVHYDGRLINGKRFDSSRGGVAPAFRLRDLIPGWTIALQQMQIGDRWEVYIPASMGYGKRSQPGIPGDSTLVFDIELLGVN
ncbi:MAG: FKBP-type peptidyl-prolyl cis-trans isomerase [Muribaculaceae bacterium]|nr:FKBP-type peptidyl-prolyl cis-trans isomerase [Muribaculaceae bacterium]